MTNKPASNPITSAPSTGEDDATYHDHEIRSFGRKRGRKLSPRQAALITGLLPRIAPDLDKPLPSRSALLAPGTNSLWLEIGFGGGEHLIWQAEHHSNATIIGCEPFEEGVVKVLSAIDELQIGNIKVHPNDARDLMRWLPDAALDRCFILFPDPWPKKRHLKRRLVSSQTLALLVRKMRPGAQLRIATDIADYIRTIMIATRATPELHWTATGPQDWRDRPDDWPQTRYETKAIAAGRKRYYLTFTRI